MTLYASERMTVNEYVISQMKKNISPLVIVKNIFTERFNVNSDIIGRDIFLTVIFHRAMWKWLYENPKKVKRDFINDFNIKDLVLNSCFLCNYVDKQSTYVDDEEGGKTLYFDCSKCPIKWPSSLIENQCLYSDHKYLFRDERDGLFAQYCHALHMDFLSDGCIRSCMETLPIIKKIYDLPLTDEVANLFRSKGVEIK